MKKLLLACIFVFAFVTAPQAQGTFVWAWGAQSQGSFYEDAYAIASDNVGNNYAVGYYANDTVMFGTDTLMNSGSADFYIIKHDELGNRLWTRRAGGTGEEYGMSVTCDTSDNVIVIGNFSSDSLIFGAFTVHNIAPGSGTPDIFIVKYSPSGTVLWAMSTGGTNWDNAGGVTIDKNTNEIYIAGAYYLSTMIFGNDTLPNRGTYDMMLLKLDAAGNPLWAQSAGGNRNDLANAVCVDDWGNVYISGGFASDTLSFPTDTLVNAFGTQPDIFTVRYTSNGTCLWARREGSIDNDHSVTIGVDDLGGVYVGGHYHSASFMFGTQMLMNMGMGDVFLIKYDSSGTAQWGKTFGGMDNDFGHSVSVAQDFQTVAIAGMFMSTSMTLGPYTVINASTDEDIFLAVLDLFGAPSMMISDGGVGRDYLNGITYGPSLQIYVAGSFGSPTFNAPWTLTNTDPGGTGEALIGRLDWAGNVQATVQNESLNIFPNPSNGIFNFTSTNTITSVTVYNALGEIVSSQNNINAQQYTLDLSSENSGMYFYSVMMSDGKVVSGTVVKQN